MNNILFKKSDESGLYQFANCSQILILQKIVKKVKKNHPKYNYFFISNLIYKLKINKQNKEHILNKLFHILNKIFLKF